jgi:hypothetical protein
MLTAILLTTIVLPALMLAHIAHESILSQRAYRKARICAAHQHGAEH